MVDYRFYFIVYLVFGSALASQLVLTPGTGTRTHRVEPEVASRSLFFKCSRRRFSIVDGVELWSSEDAA